MDETLYTHFFSTFLSHFLHIFFFFLLNIDEQNTSDYTNSPVIGSKNNGNTLTPSHKTASPSSPATDPWPSQSDEDIDRLVAMHQNRHNSLSSLGVS